MCFLLILVDTTLKVDIYLYKKNDDRYHFCANIKYKVSFDSQLNYVLHRDKASEHKNHGIRRKIMQVKALSTLGYDLNHQFIPSIVFIIHQVDCCVVVLAPTDMNENDT